MGKSSYYLCKYLLSSAFRVSSTNPVPSSQLLSVSVLERRMDEKYASLLRFVILGVAAAAHHYAVTPPTSSSVEESYVMGSKGLVEGQDLETVSWEGKRGDIGGKPSEGVLHERSITLLQLGLKLCSWSRVSLAFVLSLSPITDILLQHYSMVCGAWLL